MWDLVVVGSGGAAMAAGITASNAGRSVLLVEQAAVGGTCVNRGCVPSKHLLHGAGRRFDALRGAVPGIVTSAGSVDRQAQLAAKEALIEQLVGAKYLGVAAAHGFDIRIGEARFVGPDLLEVDGEETPAHAYLVATGAAPSRPRLPGLADVDALDSTSAMNLAELPASLVVIGGGYVGLEQAQTFADLGVAVTLIGRFAPRVEPELRQVLAESFAAHSIALLEQRATAVRSGPDGQVVVIVTDGSTVSAQRLLLATGRTPNSAQLGLDLANVNTDAAGSITVDAEQRTSNPKVFAAGDVTGALQFVYVAAATGRAAAAFALNLPDTHPVDYTGVPSVIFTKPQLASVGLTEQEVLASGGECESRTLTAGDLPRALVNGDPHAALKLVADTVTGKVLGVHAALEGAGELMLAATYAIRAGMTVDDIADAWAPYLTMSEALRLTAGLWRSNKPTSCCA